jgi:outer membrane receptor protein involved in Fe transport
VRSPLLARTRGVEVGARFDPGAGGTLEASLWGLDIDSEHVFQGDAGLSAPNRPSRRSGIELSGDCRLAAGVRVDADFAYSRARFTDQDPVGDHIPGAVEGVAAAGVAYERRAGVFGELRVRYFGPRPLIEDNSVRSQASTVLNAKAGFRAHGAWSVTLEVFNLLDRAASDVDYYYTSRLPGEPIDGISDIHFHPQGPRSFRLAVSMIEPH